MARKTDKYSVIGKRQPRLDGPLKASGRSQFSDDIRLPGMLHGKIVRSSITRGKILNVDMSLAEKLPGVKAVITYKDTNDLMIGPDQFLLCEENVKCFGDEIAAVAAVDEDTAAEAAVLIKIEYEPISPILSFEDAIAEGAPILHDHLDDNIATDHNVCFGDADKAFAEAELHAITIALQCFSNKKLVIPSA